MNNAIKCIGLVPLLFAGVLWAQEPQLANARVQSRSAEGRLDAVFRAVANSQIEPAWIGYAIAAVAGNHRICCGASSDRHLPSMLRKGRCKLEVRDEEMNFQTNDESKESGKTNYLLVLFRVSERKVGKIRVFSEECELDAGGLTVYWLTEVTSKASLPLLASFVQGGSQAVKPDRALAETAVAAIALHEDTAADQMLERFVDSNEPLELRKNTAFWLGNLRGEKGCEMLHRLVRSDPSVEIREQCVFALSISKAKEAVNVMIETAREDKSAHVRGQALFWLSQKAGQKAVKAIADAIQNDPETVVKKKAVFALSQLPRAEGVPRLISVARTNRNREARKEAMFWLGQSTDPRALAFFEEVLMK